MRLGCWGFWASGWAGGAIALGSGEGDVGADGFQGADGQGSLDPTPTNAEEVGEGALVAREPPGRKPTMPNCLRWGCEFLDGGEDDVCPVIFCSAAMLALAAAIALLSRLEICVGVSRGALGAMEIIWAGAGALGSP